MAKPLKVRIGLGTAVQKDESEVRWLISYSDFMMQLVCLFILLYSVSSIDKGKAALVAAYYRAALGLGEPPVREKPGEGDKLQVGDRPLVGGRVGAADVPPGVEYRVQATPSGRLVTFSQPIFQTGSAALAPEVRLALDRAVRDFRPYVGEVAVTAHAGGPPGDALDGDVLRLAQARARAVWEHVTREGFEGALDPRFMTATGRVTTRESEARRVEILLRAT